MDSAELRALQQPLKDAYREDPEQAVVTLRARGQLDEAVSCSVETGRALAVAGLHPATGGDGTLLCSGDMLLQALVACAGVTLRAVATSLGIDVAGGTVRAEGDLDFRGTLAVSKDAPVGFRSIRLAFDLDTDASAEQVADADQADRAVLRGVPDAGAPGRDGYLREPGRPGLTRELPWPDARLGDEERLAVSRVTSRRHGATPGCPATAKTHVGRRADQAAGTRPDPARGHRLRDRAGHAERALRYPALAGLE